MSRRIVVDYPLLIIAILLSLYGISIVYSAGQTDLPTFVSTLYKTQALWLLIGMAAPYWVSNSSVRLNRRVELASLFVNVGVAGFPLGLRYGTGGKGHMGSWLAIG